MKNKDMKNEFKITKGYLIPMAIIAGVTVVCIALIVGIVSNRNAEVSAAASRYNAEVAAASAAEIARVNAEVAKYNITVDKFTYCMQAVLSESQRSGKGITAKEAKEICKELLPK